MNQWNVIRLVAGREIRERGRSKAYLFTTGITILFVIGLIVVPGLFGGDTEQYRVGSLGEGNTAIIETAQALGNATDEEGDPPSVEFEEVVFDTRDQAEESLTAGDVDVVLIDGAELLAEREGGVFASSGPSGLLQQAAGAIALQEVMEASGESARRVVEIMSSDNLETTFLTESDGDTDQASLVAYFGLLLLYMAIILYGTWILTGVTEEKSNRVVEVILSTVKPWQLLAGKVLGIGFLALVQFVGTIAIAVLAIKVFATFEFPVLPVGPLITLAIWFVIGFLLYAVLFGAAGSLVGRVEDAQSAAMPMTIFSVVGFFAGFTVLNDAEGVVALVTTFFPFTAPFVVPIRAALNAIPAWQYALAVVITLATVYFAVRVAGRIYAGGILRMGKKTRLRDAWQASRE